MEELTGVSLPIVVSFSHCAAYQAVRDSFFNCKKSLVLPTFSNSFFSKSSDPLKLKESNELRVVTFRSL